MRCARCGNENPEGNRFCGMCGATLLAAPTIAETATQRAASAGTAPSPIPVSVVPPLEHPRPPARESQEQETDDAPIISGPSFLGLSDPNPRKRATLRADGHGSRSSRNLDYLLDDEAPEESGGAGKVILILAVLALAAGFGYMTWKNHGVGWLTAMLSKPPAATQTPSGSESSSPAPAPAETQAPVASQPAPAASQPTPTQPAADTDTGKPANPAPAQPPAPTPAKNDDSKTPSAASPPADAEEGASDEETPPATRGAEPAKPKAAAVKPPPKPNAAVAPSQPVDTVSEAQKYLYGRGGAAQDCDRGLRMLKPAANAANPKAMIEMGALYSAGLCTPRDLPTAYRWFAIALRKEPDNEAVQKDLQKLWGEMTQPERQLAIKLTQ